MKPEDVPQDVWNEAYGQALLFVQWLVPAPTDYVQAEHVLAVSFARAIMAAKAEEREACAEHLIAVAKATPLGHENQQRGKSTYNWLVHCAGLIRKRGEAD